MLETTFKVALDRDDLLMDLFPGLLSFHEERTGVRIPPAEVTEFDLTHVWRCAPEEVEPLLMQFYQSAHYLNLLPVEGAVEGVDYLKAQDCKLVIVTSTHHSAVDALHRSLQVFFPGRFAEGDVYLTNVWGGNGQHKTKPQICQEIGADVLADDNYGNLKGCREMGVQGILRRVNWNRKYSDQMLRDQGILPAENWEEIVAHIERSRPDRVVSTSSKNSKL